MPYYLFRVMPLGLLKKLDEFPRFQEASVAAKALRAADPPGTPGKVKIMFAENELQAEDLLGQVREAAPGVDD